jgi:hypothetical protein
MVICAIPSATISYSMSEQSNSLRQRSGFAGEGSSSTGSGGRALRGVVELIFSISRQP